MRRLRNQVNAAAGNFEREENLPPLQIPTMSKDMNKQIKVPAKEVEVVHRANIDLYVSGAVQRGLARDLKCPSPKKC